MPVVAGLAVILLLVAGVWAGAVMDRLALAWAAERAVGGGVTAPLRQGAAWLLTQRLRTEAPDTVNGLLAPLAYLGLAGVGLSVVPLAPGLVVTDSPVGLVLWGAVEALTVVVVFLHGWSANAPFPLIGAYRFVAIGLPAMLLSMFVLIAAALPAESLSAVAVVEAQRDLWNVVRQPPGLVLFLLLGLAITLRGPFDYADGADIAGGTKADISGAARAAWELARLGMLVSVSAMAATAFLGGYLGPWLPGPLWLVLKTLAVMALLVAATHTVARPTPSRMLTLLWTVLLPLAFLDLVLVGVEMLL
jgi:NADH-quinone oxidoreductase subunit H